MSDLKKQLRDDLTTAMKARDELRTATLRMVLAAVTAEEVPEGLLPRWLDMHPRTG